MAHGIPSDLPGASMAASPRSLDPSAPLEPPPPRSDRAPSPAGASAARSGPASVARCSPPPPQPAIHASVPSIRTRERVLAGRIHTPEGKRASPSFPKRAARILGSAKNGVYAFPEERGRKRHDAKSEESFSMILVMASWRVAHARASAHADPRLAAAAGGLGIQ